MALEGEYVQKSSSESDSDFECVEAVRLEDTINAAHTHDKLFINVQVKKKNIRFQIDTGATIIFVTRSLVPDKSRIEAITMKLKIYNNTPMATVTVLHVLLLMMN